MDRTTPVPTGRDMSTQLGSNIARLVERRKAEDARAPLGERIAARITRVAGSMGFILLHVVLYGGALLVLTDLIPFPVAWDEGFGLVGSFASVEAIFLSLFVLMNQRRDEQQSDRRSDLDLHVSLLAEDELTKLAAVIHRMADKMGVELDDTAVEEVEKNVDPEQVLDALERVEEEDAPVSLPRDSAPHEAGARAAGSSPAMKASTAS